MTGTTLSSGRCRLCATSVFTGLRALLRRDSRCRRWTPRCCATRSAASGHCWQPARGLRAAADAGLERAFVCAVDMPYLDRRSDRRTCRACPSGWVPTWCCPGTVATTTSPACTAPTSPTRADALGGAGERSMRALVDAVDTQRIVMAEQPVVDQREHRRRTDCGIASANCIANSLISNSEFDILMRMISRRDFGEFSL